jgi:small subunit ribosomal protein S18
MGKFQRFGSTPGELKLAVKSSTGTVYLDYKSVDTLRKLMSPNGKILTRKRTGLSAYEQRLAAQAIKRARYMGLLPYTSATL